MKVLKRFVLSILSFVLFLLLAVFGLAFTVNRTVLSPGIVNDLIDDIDFTQITKMAFDQSLDFPNLTSAEIDLQNAVIVTIGSAQPVVKGKLKVAVQGTYGYLINGNKAPDLKMVLSDSFMNAYFVTEILANIDLTDLVQQAWKETTSVKWNFVTVSQSDIMAVIAKLESDIKQQLANASDPIFKYLLGQTNAIDIKTISRNTILSNSFISKVIDNVDLQTFAYETLNSQFGPLPGGINLTNDQFDRVLVLLEPVVKNGLKTGAGSIADYLAGETNGFDINISFQSVLPSCKPIIKEAFLANLPIELKRATPLQINAAYEVYWNDFQNTSLLTFNFNETMFSPDITNSVEATFADLAMGLAGARNALDKAVSNTQDNLGKARVYVGYFRTAFFALIIMILIVIGGIVLIFRSLKRTCLWLGIMFMVYGVLAFVGVVTARVFAPVILHRHAVDLPQFITDSMLKLVGPVTAPLIFVSLGSLIGGIGLIFISIYSGRESRQ